MDIGGVGAGKRGVRDMKIRLWRYYYPQNYVWWKPWTWPYRRKIYQGEDYDAAKKKLIDTWPSKEETEGRK